VRNIGLQSAYKLVYVGTQKLYTGEILKSLVKRREKLKEKSVVANPLLDKKESQVKRISRSQLKLFQSYILLIQENACLFYYIEFQYLIFVDECSIRILSISYAIFNNVKDKEVTYSHSWLDLLNGSIGSG